MTKASELREMSDEQLGLLIKETKEHFFRLRLQAQTERLDAPSELRKQRRLIARINTVPPARAARGEGRPAAAKQTACGRDAAARNDGRRAKSASTRN